MDFRYFIGISLPPKSEMVFNQVKKSFHPNHRLTSPAHITLISPFYWTNQTLLLGQLAKSAQQFDPFTVNFEKVASFKQLKYGTVYLAPDKVENFKRLALTLQETILRHQERGEFIPHLTLAQKVIHQDLDRVKRQIRNMNLSLKLKVDKLTLFKFDNQLGVWSKFYFFPFRNQV